ncbi:tetratricopeptide repeat protein [Peribacillus sp. NPDC097295]|uniref:tetratricopeptide repeat protein n=1 Tax=Peribacillus sp. NPDC097295 TaxID=3364402 RepID=UPI003828B3A5
MNVEVDYEESLKWYLKSAKNENTSAMVNLAYLYGNGIGVEKDLTNAFKWNLEAANSGDSSGINFMFERLWILCRIMKQYYLT